MVLGEWGLRLSPGHHVTYPTLCANTKYFARLVDHNIQTHLSLFQPREIPYPYFEIHPVLNFPNLSVQTGISSQPQQISAIFPHCWESVGLSRAGPASVPHRVWTPGLELTRIPDLGRNLKLATCFIWQLLLFLSEDDQILFWAK